MLDTLTSSSGNGGGIEAPPAPPEGGDDWYGEFHFETGDQIAARRRERLSPLIADLSLHDAVFAIDRPVNNEVMPWLDKYNVHHSNN